MVVLLGMSMILLWWLVEVVGLILVSVVLSMSVGLFLLLLVSRLVIDLVLLRSVLMLMSVRLFGISLKVVSVEYWLLMFGLVRMMCCFVLWVFVLRGELGLVMMMMCLVGLMPVLVKVWVYVWCWLLVLIVLFDLLDMMIMVWLRWLVSVVWM